MLDSEASLRQQDGTEFSALVRSVREEGLKTLGHYESCNEYEFRRLPRFAYHRRNGKTRDRIRDSGAAVWELAAGSEFAVAAQANCQCALHM
jgi:hypothetical protein